MSWRLSSVLVVSLVAIPLIQREIDSRLGGFRVQDEILYMWSPAHVKALAGGFEGLTADVYWLRTVQYFGGERRSAGHKNFALLGPLVEIATTLDPRLELAYRYGAIFLCEPNPIGAGRCGEGLALLEKGAQALPDDWRLLQQKGYFAFLFLDDPEQAVIELRRAAKRPGAAFWLEMQAADLLSKGGRRAAARRMWSELLSSAEGDLMKENARLRLRILDAEDAADDLSAAARRFRADRGAFPATLEELRAHGYWKHSLNDPDGVRFEYEPAEGWASVSTHSPLWRRDIVKRNKP